MAHTAPRSIDGLERAVMAFEQQLDTERRAPPDAQDDSAGKLALARAITRPGEESEMVRITSERAQRRYSPVHIDARVAQCDALLERLVALHNERLNEALAVLGQAVRMPGCRRPGGCRSRRCMPNAAASSPCSARSTSPRATALRRCRWTKR